MSTKERILEAGVFLAEQHGVRGLTRTSVARHLGVSGTLIVHYFQTTENLRREIFKHGLSNASTHIVCEGLISGNIEKAPATVCRHICEEIMSYAGEH